MDGVEKQPHILLSTADVRPVVVTVGDPARVKLIADQCDSFVPLVDSRSYRSYDCSYRGQNFTVISHGIGAPSAAICFEELIKLGAKVIIRAGTCGSLQPGVHTQGDLMVCHCACAADGVTQTLAPPGYPAVGDIGTHVALLESAKAAGIKVKSGMVVSAPVFYCSPFLPSPFITWSKAGIDVQDMEASALFVIAKLRGVKAGCILAVDGCLLDMQSSDIDPSGSKMPNAMSSMIQIVSATAAKLSEDQLNELRQS